jgi:hypothetical protein
MFGPLADGATVGRPRVVGRGEADVGLSPQGGQHQLGAVTVVGQLAAVVEGGHRPGVPGVGGLAAAALAHIAAEDVEGAGAQEVDDVPRAALGALDGPGPGVGDVRCAVVTVAGDEGEGTVTAAWPKRTRRPSTSAASTVPTEPLCSLVPDAYSWECSSTRSPGT